MRRHFTTPLMLLVIGTVGLVLFLIYASKNSAPATPQPVAGKDVQQMVALVWESFSSRLIPSVIY